MPKVDKNNPRIGAVARITGIRRTVLVRWIERGVIRLSADKRDKEHPHRRLTLDDVMKVALVGAFSQYGIEVATADKMIDALLKREAFAVYVGNRKDPFTGESIKNSLRGCVWTLWPDGDKWLHIASNKPAAEDDLETYFVVHVGKIIDRVLTRFKAYTDPYYEPIVREIEREK
jgi:hypothetical protein